MKTQTSRIPESVNGPPEDPRPMIRVGYEVRFPMEFFDAEKLPHCAGAVYVMKRNENTFELVADVQPE